MNIRALTIAAGLAVAGSANAGFLGVDFVFDAARSASANANAGLVGGPVDIYMMYAGYDLATDSFLNIFNVNMTPSSNLIDQAGGGDLAPNAALFAFLPTEWDTFVTVGGLSDAAAPAGSVASGGGVGLSTTGIVNGDWFTTPPTGLGTPVFNADLGMFTVVLGQFAVAQGARATFTGDYELSWNDAASTTTQVLGSGLTGNPNGFGFIPTPGAMALFGLAGLTAGRRRRA